MFARHNALNQAELERRVDAILNSLSVIGVSELPVLVCDQQCNLQVIRDKTVEWSRTSWPQLVQAEMLRTNDDRTFDRLQHLIDRFDTFHQPTVLTIRTASSVVEFPIDLGLPKFQLEGALKLLRELKEFTSTTLGAIGPDFKEDIQQLVRNALQRPSTCEAADLQLSRKLDDIDDPSQRAQVQRANDIVYLIRLNYERVDHQCKLEVERYWQVDTSHLRIPKNAVGTDHCLVEFAASQVERELSRCKSQITPAESFAIGNVFRFKLRRLLNGDDFGAALTAPAAVSHLAEIGSVRFGIVLTRWGIKLPAVREPYISSDFMQWCESNFKGRADSDDEILRPPVSDSSPSQPEVFVMQNEVLIVRQDTCEDRGKFVRFLSALERYCHNLARWEAKEVRRDADQLEEMSEIEAISGEFCQSLITYYPAIAAVSNQVGSFEPAIYRPDGYGMWRLKEIMRRCEEVRRDLERLTEDECAKIADCFRAALPILGPISIGELVVSLRSWTSLGRLTVVQGLDLYDKERVTGELAAPFILGLLPPVAYLGLLRCLTEQGRRNLKLLIDSKIISVNAISEHFVAALNGNSYEFLYPQIRKVLDETPDDQENYDHDFNVVFAIALGLKNRPKGKEMVLLLKATSRYWRQWSGLSDIEY